MEGQLAFSPEVVRFTDKEPRVPVRENLPLSSLHRSGKLVAFLSKLNLLER